MPLNLTTLIEKSLLSERSSAIELIKKVLNDEELESSYDNLSGESHKVYREEIIEEPEIEEAPEIDEENDDDENPEADTETDEEEKETTIEDEENEEEQKENEP